MNAQDAAFRAHAAGLAVLPVAEDGSKRPDVPSWTGYQRKRPTDAILAAWFGNGRERTGLGIVTGAMSGVEMLEFEGRAVEAGLERRFRELVTAAGLDDVLDRVLAGYVEGTPTGGLHLLYRVETPKPNRKLASRPDGSPLIETRGEGGFVVVAPSNGRCHPSGKPWTLICGSFETIATISNDDRDELFRIAEMLDELPAAEVRPPWTATAAGDRPGDRLAADPDVRDFILDILERHGWSKIHERGSTLFLRRPGKEHGISATLGHVAPGVLRVFTTSTEFEARAHHPFSVYARLEHGGDYAAAASALAERYPGPRERAAKMAADTSPALLPAEFWDSRPYLAHIRQAAQGRRRAPDAVLGAVLARTAALLPHTLGLPPVVGTVVGLGLLVAIVSPPGRGKSGAAGIGDELLPADLTVIPSGSGEGLAEAFFDWIDVPGANGKARREKRQVRHNLFVYVDELQRATRQAQQASSTLFGTYRSIFTGALIGDANASAERRRIVPKGGYSIGLVAAAQPEVLGPLFDDLAIGTPQRFLYLAGTDPTLPDERPDWPGRLSLGKLDLDGAQRQYWLPSREPAPAWEYHVKIERAVAMELDAADLRKSRGREAGDAWAAHRNLLRLKVATLLAVLDGGRLTVTEDDWQLAGMVVEVSDAVRRQAQATIANVAADREAETSTRLARRTVQAVELTEERRTVHCIDAIVAKVGREPGELTRGQLRASLGSRQREYFGEAFDKAIGAGWIEERSEPGGQDKDRSRLYPGKARP